MVKVQSSIVYSSIEFDVIFHIICIRLYNQLFLLLVYPCWYKVDTNVGISSIVYITSTEFANQLKETPGNEKPKKEMIHDDKRQLYVIYI